MEQAQASYQTTINNNQAALSIAAEREEEIKSELNEERKQKEKLSQMIESNCCWVTTQRLHPDGQEMVYDEEWPKNAADYARLF